MPVRFDTPWHARPHAPPAGTPLCRTDDIPEATGKGLRFGEGPDAFEIILVRRGGAVTAYVNQCPHFKVALNARPDAFVNSEGDIMCAWHYARFRPEDGFCFNGPCEGMSLVRIPVAILDGTVSVDRTAAGSETGDGTPRRNHCEGEQ